MKFLLGIDIGTTSTKTLLINENSTVLATSTYDYKLTIPKPGWAEQAPEDWWNAVVKTIKDIIKKSDVSPKDIVCI